MKQYRPTIEQVKKRYSADMARRKVQARRDAARDPNAKRVITPDNSESLAERIWVSNQVAASIEQWNRTFQKSFHPSFSWRGSDYPPRWNGGDCGRPRQSKDFGH